MRPFRFLMVIFALLATSFALVASPQLTLASDRHGSQDGAQPHSIVVFDPPTSVFTEPYSINSFGTVAGYYQDAQFVVHGFIRDSAGNFTIVDAPGASTEPNLGTYILSINDSGEVVGYFNPASAPTTYQGYLLDGQGNFTLINVPGATDTQPFSLNNAGQMTGCSSRTIQCNDSNVFDSGFVRDASGVFSRFLVPNAINIISLSINNSGIATGFYMDTLFATHGLVRTSAGKIVVFDEPNAYVKGGYDGTKPWAINDSGIIVGFYQDSSATIHGFIRNNAGAFTSFDAPGVGTTYTLPLSISSKGAITGYYFDSTTSAGGFVRSSAGSTFTFTLPGATETYGNAINASQQVTGNYLDADQVSHGFLFQ